MKYVHHLATLTLALCAAQVPAVAQAQPVTADASSGWYAGGSLGQSGQKLRTENINVPTTGSQTTTDSGYKLFGGYQFDRNWAAELQYVDLGKYKYADQSGGTAVVKTSGFSASAVGSWPVTEKMSLLGKVGLAQQTFAVSIVTPSSEQSRRISGSTMLLGLGGEYEISKNLLLRTEYEYFGVPTLFSAGNQKLKLSSNLLSVGFRYRF